MGEGLALNFYTGSLFLFLIVLSWQLAARVFKRLKSNKSMVNKQAQTTTATETTTSLKDIPTYIEPQQSLIEFIGLNELKKGDLAAIGRQAISFIQRLLATGEECWLWQLQGSRFELLATSSANQLPASWAVTGSLAAAINELTEPLYVPDLKLDSFGFYDQLMVKLVEMGKRSLIIAPLNKMAVLVVASSLPAAFSEIDQTKLASVTVQLSYIFSVWQQQRETREELEKERFVHEAIIKLQSKPTLQDKIKEVLALAVKISQADTGSFLIYDHKAKKLKVKAVIGETKGIAPGVEIAVGQGIAGWVAQHKKPLLINDPSNWQKQGDTKIASSISLPITTADVLVGVLNLGSLRSNYQFSLQNLKPVMHLLAQFGDALVSASQNEQWQKLYFKTVAAITQLVEKKEPYYEGHTAKVAKYAKLIAQGMGVKEQEVFLIELASLLHDIGVSVSEAAVFEGRPLTTLERLALQNHPKVAVQALADIPQLSGVLPIILHHHENFDGSGYIDGLKGEEIPLGARILRVAEAFTAMTSPRPYRQAKSKEEALDELKRLSGSQFDPKVVYTFSKLIETQVQLD